MTRVKFSGGISSGVSEDVGRADMGCRMAPASDRWRVPCLLGGFLLLACMAGCGRKPAPSNRVTKAAAEDPVAVVEPQPLREIRFRNADPTVAYIGSEACAECHQQQHGSYLDTPHSRALGAVSASDPAPDEYDHPTSGRSYRVSMRDGVMYHAAATMGDQDPPLVAVEHPVKYAIGSGHHSRSYLCELDGFLIESPITWYASTQSWKMSPGYDRARHGSFQRQVDTGCLFCHAGRIEQNGGRYQNTLHEQSIGCESCHGPGELHAQRHADHAHEAEAFDDTIVNLSRLTRAESESVCASCHLRGDASVLLQGRRLTDFRPGRLIEEIRVDFARQTDDGSMTVVGHVAQMRQSRCYQNSAEMTCTTCHDPHFRPQQRDAVAYFRNKCLQCHDEQTSCGMPRAERLAKSEQDNCVTCHMPTGDTDIPHFAFTHHRVGLHAPSAHDEGNADSRSAGGEPIDSESLLPIQSTDHLSDLQVQRARGLAHIELIAKTSNDFKRKRHIDRASELLEQAHAAGMRDSDVESALARLAWMDGDYLGAMEHAQAALSRDPNHVNAAFVLADSLFQRKELARASRWFQRLTELRRLPEDWVSLGQCQLQLGDNAAGLASLRKAIEISPFRAGFYEAFAEAAGALGNTTLAKEFASKAAQLRRILK